MRWLPASFSSRSTGSISASTCPATTLSPLIDQHAFHTAGKSGGQVVTVSGLQCANAEYRTGKAADLYFFERNLDRRQRTLSQHDPAEQREQSDAES